MIDRIINNYFLTIFSILPVAIVVGSSVSLINVLLIDISFIFYLIYKKEKFYQKNKVLKYLIILFIYLAFNTIISIDYNLSAYRNLGFIRLIILFLAFNYFFKENVFLHKVLKIWCVIILIVVLDVFYETAFGKNILGFASNYGERIVSFFKDEPIVGGYLNAFYLIVIGFLLNNYDNKNKLIFCLSLAILASIVFTGERSNTIKAFAGFLILFSIYPKFTLKFKVTSFLTIVIIGFLVIFNNNSLKKRFIEQIQALSTKEGNPYSIIYKSGFKVFYNNPILGVGTKNYRVETCNNLLQDDDYICQTHPHQIYLEFLAEHGLIGSIIIFYLLYKIIFSKIRLVISSQNYIQTGAGIYMILVFFPFIPSGAFFSDYLITLFSINLAIFYCSNSKTNTCIKNA